MTIRCARRAAFTLRAPHCACDARCALRVASNTHRVLRIKRAARNAQQY